MNVTESEKRLLQAALAYVQSGDAAQLKSSAIAYGKSKMDAWRSRDRWKMRNRANMTEKDAPK